MTSNKMISELMPNINQFSKYKENTETKIYVFSLYEPLTCDFFNEKFHHYRTMNKKWMEFFPKGTLSKIDNVDLNMFSMFQNMTDELTSDFNDFDSFMIRVTDYQTLKTIIIIYIVKDHLIHEISFPDEECSSILDENPYYLLKKTIEYEELKTMVKNPCSVEVMKLKTSRSILEITSQEELACFNVTDDNILEYEDGDIGISKLYEDFQIFMMCGYDRNFDKCENPDKEILSKKLELMKLDQDKDHNYKSKNL